MPSLLTIVFTDVVDSSATKRDVSLGRDPRERDHSYLEQVQSPHFSLIRECSKAHQGREVNTMGDAFYLIFEDPVDAVRCAVDIQRRLRSHPIETPRGPLRLRIGIHSGYPKLFEGTYHGTDVDKAARVEAMATAQQILISSTTYELVAQMTDVKFHRKGEFSLKGLDRVVLWEAAWDDARPRATAVAPLDAQRRTKRRIVIAAVLAIILVLAGATGYRYYVVRQADALPGSAATAIHSLAVLPLANLSGDSSQDFFADGMTAELIREVSKITQLRVVSRTSVMSYKGTHPSLPQIARELNVNALLEGSVARSGSHVRIAVGLYDGASERELWSGTFDRDLKDVLALEDEVAHAIALQIRLKFAASPGTPVSINADAYDLYLKGQYALDQGSADDLNLAFVYFRQGIEKSPQYAPLYAGLADAYGRLPFYTNMRPREAFPKAKEAAAKALQLEPTLAEAHASMAYVLNYYDWDRSGAEQEFKRALELDPNDASAHHLYGRFLASMGRVDEARAQVNRAQELDPLSLGIQSNVGMLSYFARQYENALQQLRKVLDLNPKFPVPYWGIGMCYEQLKRYPDALAQFQKGIELSGRGANEIASLAHVYGLAGQRAEAQKILAELTARSKSEYVSSYQFAVIYVGLGNNERALAALEQAYNERSTLLGYLKMDPRFDPLRSDPRFQNLLRRIHLPE